MNRYLTPSSTLMDNEFDFDTATDAVTSALDPQTTPPIVANNANAFGLPDILGGANKAIQTPAQIISAIQTANISDDCKKRFAAIIAATQSGTVPSPLDISWAQTMMNAALSNGQYPAECAVTPFPWVWVAAGGGALLLLGIIWFAGRKSRKK
ncbi:MAG: hypothetical protein ABI876_10505 [Bacteroidota bacterium]